VDLRNKDIEYCSVVKLLVHLFWWDGISRGGFEEEMGFRGCLCPDVQ